MSYIYKVLRGGCWGNGLQDLRSAQRFDYVPRSRSYVIGFRLVREKI